MGFYSTVTCEVLLVAVDPINLQAHLSIGDNRHQSFYSAIMQIKQSKSSKSFFFFVFVLFLGVAGCKERPRRNVLTVFAASSLTAAVSEIAAAYEEQEDVQVRLSFASSGTLARQIAMGAEVDLFISANTDWVGYLEEKQLIESWKDIAWNRLVLITYSGSRFDGLDTLTLASGSFSGGDKLTIGYPETVPAGMYARQALKYYGVYQQLKPYYLMAKDANTALRYVELKEALLGIVYHSDAVRSQFVAPIFYFPGTSHDPVVCRAALISRNKQAAAILEYLQNRDVVDIWEKHGFTSQGRN